MRTWLRMSLYGLLLWVIAAVYAVYGWDLLPGLLAGMLWRETGHRMALCSITGSLLMAARQETDPFAVLFFLPAVLLLGRYLIPRLRPVPLPLLSTALFLGYGSMCFRAGAAWCFGLPMTLPWLQQGICAVVSAIIFHPFHAGIARIGRRAVL